MVHRKFILPRFWGQCPWVRHEPWHRGSTRPAAAPILDPGGKMSKHKSRWWLLALAAYGSALGAQTRPAITSESPGVRSHDLTAAERAAGWRLLFDGRTLKGWRGLGYDTVPTAHWVVVDGTIKKIASGKVPRLPDGQPLNGGDLMTVDTFGDFELTWEWRGAPRGPKGGKDNDPRENPTKKATNHATPGCQYQNPDDARRPHGTTR